MDLTPELRALYSRAVADPASITPAEKHQILEIPPPEEADRLIAAKAPPHKSRADLVAKALADPDGLTWAETELLKLNPVYHDSAGHRAAARTSLLSRIGAQAQLAPADRELKEQARDAVETSDEVRARNAAYARAAVLHNERRAEKERELEARQRARDAPRAKWVQEIQDASPPRWGFVCFRAAFSGAADDEAWARFQGYFARTGRTALSLWKGGPELWALHETVFYGDAERVQGDGSMDVLRRWFRELSEAGEIPEGVRKDAFLVVDEAAMLHEMVVSDTLYTPASIMGRGPKSAKTPFVKAVDPTYNLSSEEATGTTAASDEFPGELLVPLPKVFDWLHYTLFSGSESWKTRYRQTKTKDWNSISLPYSPYPGY